MKIKCIAAFCLALTGFTSNAQSLTQTVRGIVTDKISQTPIPGVMVVLLNSEPKKGVSTNESGEFKLTGVPVGKQTFSFSMMGYKNFTLPNVVVNSGKEVVLNIALEENVVQTDEVTITAKINKNRPLNDMSVVSSRTFSVEETQKYAAAFNDPARMASAFPGVVMTGDPSNTISIRGNSPNAILWRMEGVEIPNPNHFSNVGSAGGGISILSAQLLTNSDFSTGAFAAEYGNALGGVFDLKLRKGNNEKHEYTIQTGFLGIDLSAEGPFKKGYGGSYLINYRYSTLGIISKMGVEIGDASTLFQDLSFNVSLPTKKAGTFTAFGFGGLSSQTTEAIKDTSVWAVDGFKRYNTDFRANTGAAGITHTVLTGKKSFLRTALVYSGTQNSYFENRLSYSDFAKQDTYSESYVQKKATLQSVFNSKFNSQHSIRCGFILNNLDFSLLQKQLNDSTNKTETKLDSKGNTFSLQAFTQWKYRITDRVTFNAGLHYLQFFLNNSWSLEPRASFKYDLTPRQSLSLGYGLHSQVQPLGLYFTQNASTVDKTPNKNTGLSKAHHAVLGYDLSLTEFWRIKLETYYQYLFNIPQGVNANLNYCVINNEGGYDQILLNNGGTARNYGVELTIEQFMRKNSYLLQSISVFDSKYKGTDGKMHNTRYNTNYTFSLTAGKEFELSEKRKKRIIGTNLKMTYTGGLRQTPVDKEASAMVGYTIRKNQDAYAEQMPAFFRTDIGISLKRNYKKVTGTLSLDIQNVTNRQNVAGSYYDIEAEKIKYYYGAGLIPILSYRLQF